MASCVIRGSCHAYTTYLSRPNTATMNTNFVVYVDATLLLRVLLCCCAAIYLVQFSGAIVAGRGEAI